MWLHLTLLSAFLTTSSSWILQTNVDEISPGETKFIQIECRQDHDQDKKSDIKTIARIRILKFHAFAHKTSLAEISLRKNVVMTATDDSVNVTGTIAQGKVAFLKMIFSNVTGDDAGAYGCEINGIDERDNFVTHEVAPRVIKEKIISMMDVEKLLETMKKENEQRQNQIEAENVNLKMLLNNTLEILESMKSQCATKIELAEKNSETMNFTSNAMKTEREVNEQRYKHYQNTVNNTSDSLETKVSKVSDDLLTMSNHINELNRRIYALENNNENVLQYVNSSFRDIDSKLNTTDMKYEIITNDLKDDFNKIKAETKCPNQPTTPTPTPKRQIQWPGGKYGLVKPLSGCPLKSFQNIYSPRYPKDFKLAFMSEGGSYHTIRLCMMYSKSFTTWPKGEYCIKRDSHSGCPTGFSAGSITFDRQSIFSNAHYSHRFCCRSDGSPHSPIELPTEKAFFLYRYMNMCQQVSGMVVTQTSTKLIKTSTFTIQRKDLGTVPQGYTVLCHYEPSATSL